MTIFSPKVKRLIDAAVARSPDDDGRLFWRDWESKNPDIRRPGDAVFAREHVPEPIARAALRGLEHMRHDLALTLTTRHLDEDEVCDIEGDISFIRSVESMLMNRARVDA